MNSVTDVERFSVSTSRGKGLPVPNPIPLILDIITVRIAWMIASYARSVEVIKQGGVVSP